MDDPGGDGAPDSPACRRACLRPGGSTLDYVVGGVVGLSSAAPLRRGEEGLPGVPDDRVENYFVKLIKNNGGVFPSSQGKNLQSLYNLLNTRFMNRSII